MKFEWTAEDVRGGREFRKPDCGVTGRYLIGYRYRTEAEKAVRGSDRWPDQVWLVVSLADGMAVTQGSKETIAKWINDTGHMVPLTIEVGGKVLGPCVPQD